MTLPLSYSRGEIDYIRRPDFGPPVPPIPPTAPRPRSANRSHVDRISPSSPFSITCGLRRHRQPPPAAGPTANGLKHIDSNCLIGNWLCSVKKLLRRNPPSSNSAILIPTARQRSGHPYFARTIKELSSSAITLHQPAAKPGPNSLESIDSTCLIGNWLCSVKIEFRAQIRTPSTKQHKPAQPTTHHPQAITPAPYFRSTLKLGSSCTFTGACGSATLNVTGPSAVRTQCVKVLPCPN